MEAIIQLLTPSQIELILTTYTSIEEWVYATAVDVSEMARSIVVEDIVL